MNRGPVFIVGAPRSGTSILYRTLLKHPSFAVIGDEALQLAESGLLDQIEAAPRWRPGRPPRLWRFFLADEERYREFLDEVARAVSDAGPGGSVEDWAGPVIRAFILHGRRARKCRRLLEKTPTHIDRAGMLLAAEPSARLLYIHRHPVDVYSSYRRRAAVDPAATWADLSVEEFATVYNRQSGEALVWAEREPSRFLLVSYLAFTTDPDSETRRICEFVDEEFQPAMIVEERPDLGRARFDPHLYGDIVESTKDWSEFVDVDSARRVEDLTWSTATALGHRRRLTDGRSD